MEQKHKQPSQPTTVGCIPQDYVERSQSVQSNFFRSRFDAEQVSDIKSDINLFGDDKQSHRAAGDFLYITAKQKGNLDNREQIKARREVDNVVEGHYDQRQNRDFPMRR